MIRKFIHPPCDIGHRGRSAGCLLACFALVPFILFFLSHRSYKSKKLTWMVKPLLYSASLVTLEDKLVTYTWERERERERDSGHGKLPLIGINHQSRQVLSLSNFLVVKKKRKKRTFGCSKFSPSFFLVFSFCSLLSAVLFVIQVTYYTSWSEETQEWRERERTANKVPSLMSWLQLRMCVCVCVLVLSSKKLLQNA